MSRPLLCPSCGGALDAEARACPQCGTTAATRRCAACLSLCLRQDRNCRACGTLLPREAAGSREGALECPGCGAAMTRRVSGATSFDECDRCSGVWLEPATLGSLSTAAETRAALRLTDARHAGDAAARGEAEAIRYRPCPACRALMNRTNFALGSGVVVDVCRHHGSWFDAGEVARILDFIEGGGLERARRREVERLEARASDAKRRAAAANGEADLPLGFSPEPQAHGPVMLEILHWIGDLLRSRI